MKNKTQAMYQQNQINVPDWLYETRSLVSRKEQECFSILQETTEDDFLLGKTPKNLEFTWEEEE